MPVVPTKTPEKIGWYQERQASWTTNSTALGFASGDMTTMTTKITAAANALTALTAAKTAAKDATVALHQATQQMGDLGSALIKKIRAKAEQDGNNNAYVLASVPPPATPSPRGKPGTPSGLKVELKPNGSLELKWKCTNPVGAQGTFYYVYRKLTSDPGPYDFLGASGQRDFIDETVPAGTPIVFYQIQAARTNAVGDQAEFVVKLGMNTGGSMTASVTESSPKLAA